MFNRRIALGYAGALIVCAGVGIIGLTRMTNAAARAARAGHTGNCLMYLHQVRDCQQNVTTVATGPENTADLLAAAEWKKAKDRFLFEFKKLSQSPPLNEQERQIIRDIENAWKGYDASFRKYVLALNRSDRPAKAQSAIEMQMAMTELLGHDGDLAGCTGLCALAAADVNQTIHEARLWLGFFTALILALGLGSLFVVLWRRKPAAEKAVVAPQNEQSSTTGSLADDWTRLAETLTSEVRNLTTLLGNLETLGQETVEKKDPPNTTS